MLLPGRNPGPPRLRQHDSSAMTARPENRIAIAIGIVSLIAGIVTLATLSGTAQVVAASALLGLSGIAFISLVFLLVGQSEEDDRREHPNG